jgi:hypothetical protein
LFLAAFVIYPLILWFYQYTYDHVQYEFFPKELTIDMVVSYALIFFGSSWMQTALKNNDDWLNGAIIMSFGVIILLGVIINNFKKTPKLYAIAGSLAQLIFYIPITMGAVIIVALMMGVASQTKPVYNLNSKD